ncbi:Glycosyl transferase group 1 family protein [Candidatus Erwinia haradaeae]|uniref:Glycosyl transferase group 1 family protein n=1 Tax=Candidatus Erwinia haradaeae TaxID=1922217 RepID=A0A451DJ57_9GAMM|nr:glycosyltransferase family 4 protein [Candidatus Erwinia haradaeae]VFP86737.1 Glycosyl transferase group 1 family protein [Candidatus Erwinia haradaeae]
MNTIRFAIVRQKYRPDGGAEKFITYALEALATLQIIDLNIIARQWQSKQKTNWTLHKCDPLKWGRINRERGFAYNARKLWRRENFNIVQSHERIAGCDIYRAGDGVHQSWLEQRSRILPKWHQKLLFLSSYHRYVIQAERIMYQAPELKAVICNSRMVQQEITAQFGVNKSKIHVIYNIINTKEFFPASEFRRLKIRKLFSLPLTAPLLIYVGSGFERKGLKAAIYAIAKTHYYLIVVGRDKAEKKYHNIAKDLYCANRVIFVGVQVNMCLWYQASDGLLLPTLYDPCPNVILEAMACGLPIITSTKCGGNEFILPGKNGYICDAMDINAIADAIMALPRWTFNSLASNYARSQVLPLSAQYLSQQLLSLYRKILS